MLIVLINCHTTALLRVSSSLSSPLFISPLLSFPSLNCRRTNWSRDCCRLFDLCYFWQQLAPVMLWFFFCQVVRVVYVCVRLHARACLSKYITHTYMYIYTYIHVRSYTHTLELYINACLAMCVRQTYYTWTFTENRLILHCNTLRHAAEHTATHCYTLRHTPTHSNTVCYSGVQYLDTILPHFSDFSSVLQCAAVHCAVLQCIAMWCSVLQCIAMCCSMSAVCCSVCSGKVCSSVLQCIAVYCSVLQCIAVYRSVSQCIAIWCSTWTWDYNVATSIQSFRAEPNYARGLPH